MAEHQPPVSATPRRALPSDEDLTATPRDKESSDSTAHAAESSAATKETVPPQPDDPEAPQEPDAAHSVRPARPPVINTRAEVIERTRPGRIQGASEWFWGVAVLFGILAFITAWIGHRMAVDALVAQVPGGAAGEDGQEAAKILHYTALGLTGFGVLVEAIQLAFLRRRRISTRVLLTILALASVVLLPLTIDVLGQGNWLAIVVRVSLITQVIAAIVGSVLMWLPIGTRRPA